MNPIEIVQFLKNNSLTFWNLLSEIDDEIVSSMSENDKDIMERIGEVEEVESSLVNGEIIVHFKNYDFYIKEDEFDDGNGEDPFYKYSLVHQTGEKVIPIFGVQQKL
ncbi:MAG: hypothetical protein IPI46_12345 [Bacteroidetes bacterium]|nr:hypothetical protein [Bacteroidota bacterium]